MAGWDGIWGGMLVGAAVAALALAALSLSGRQPAGNRPPEAPAVAPPEVAAPALAVGSALSVAEPAGAPSARRLASPDLRPFVRPGMASRAEGSEASPDIDTAPAAIPAAATPLADLGEPETGGAPLSPAGEARAPARAVAARPSAPAAGAAPSVSDASPAPLPAGAVPEGGLTGTLVPARALGRSSVAAEVPPFVPAAPSDPRPLVSGRAGSALVAASDGRLRAEVARSAAAIAATEAPAGGLGKGPIASPAGP